MPVRRTVIAFITERSAVKSILESLGLPTTAPPLAAARLDFDSGVEVWQDDVPTLQQSLRSLSPGIVGTISQILNRL